MRIPDKRYINRIQKTVYPHYIFKILCLFAFLFLFMAQSAFAVTFNIPGGHTGKASLIPMEVFRDTKDLIVSRMADGRPSYYLSDDGSGHVIFYDPVRNLYVFNGRRQEVLPKGLYARGWTLTGSVESTLYGTIPGVPGQTGFEQLTLMQLLAIIYDFYEDVVGLDGFNGSGGAFYAVADAFYSDKNFKNENDNRFVEWTSKILYRTFMEYDQAISYMTVPETALTIFYNGTNKFYTDDTATWESLTYVAHEYTHAVFNAALAAGTAGTGSNTSAVLDSVNEAYADIFSQLIKAYYEGSDPSWIFAEDVGVSRNMKERKGNSLFNVSDFHDSEPHNASTILSHAMYLTWKNWRDKNIPVTECIQDMADLLYGILPDIPADCSFDTIGDLLGGMSRDMKADGKLTIEQREGLKNSLNAVGIPFQENGKLPSYRHRDYEIWKQCLTEAAVSVMETRNSGTEIGKISPQAKELAMARIAAIHGRDQATFYNGYDSNSLEGIEKWENNNGMLTMNLNAFVSYETYLFGTENTLNDMLMEHPENLLYFKAKGKENNTTVQLSTPSVQTAASAGWTCRIELLQRNRDRINVQGLLQNGQNEKAFYAYFSRSSDFLDGAFFYGFHLDWIEVFDESLDGEDVFEVETIHLPKAEPSTKEILETFVTENLLSSRGQAGPEPLFTSAEAMYPVSEWTEDDLDGILGWKISDFDADGADELLIFDLQQGQTLELTMYESAETAGGVPEASVSMKFKVPMSFLTLWGLQINCFFYNVQENDRPYIALDSHYTIMESVSTLLLFQYNGNEFKFIHGFGYHEQGEGDVYLYDVETEPVSDFALNCASLLFEPDCAWHLKTKYMAEEHDWTLLSKEEERNTFYAPYKDAIHAFGLSVQDTRLWALQDDWNGEGSYSEYYNRYSNIWTADVYTPADTSSDAQITIVGGLNLFYIMEGQSFLQFVN